MNKPVATLKQIWRMPNHDAGFTLEIVRWESPAIETPDWSKPLEYKWNLYAYIYREHPLFGEFSFNSREYLEKSVVMDMPFHGGCTFLEYNYVDHEGYGEKEKVYEIPEKVSVKIGCDYSHYGDEWYEATKDIEYTGIIDDANVLAEYLLNKQPAKLEYDNSNSN